MWDALDEGAIDPTESGQHGPVTTDGVAAVTLR